MLYLIFTLFHDISDLFNVTRFSKYKLNDRFYQQRTRERFNNNMQSVYTFLSYYRSVSDCPFRNRSCARECNTRSTIDITTHSERFKLIQIYIQPATRRRSEPRPIPGYVPTAAVAASPARFTPACGCGFIVPPETRTKEDHRGTTSRPDK